MSSAVQNLIQQFIEAADAAPAALDNDAHEQQHEQEYYDEHKIGSVIMDGGGAGADVWACFEGDDDDGWLEFRGWRSDGSWWCVECNVDENIERTLKTVCQAANDLDQTPSYIRVNSVVYSVDMPDCTMTRAATLNQCMDFPSQRWVDVRDQDQWYDVHMVLRVC